MSFTALSIIYWILGIILAFLIPATIVQFFIDRRNKKHDANADNEVEKK